ncbi:MAG: class I SAM-dependent methyltransferase [Bacillota bacterium]
MYDARFWASAWREARSASSLGRGYANRNGWKDFWNLVAPRYARRNRETQHIVDEVVRLLAGNGVVGRQSEVLDIGCGPGTYTLPLAGLAARVVGLDTADKMLDVLKQEAAHYGVAASVDVVAADWDDYPAQPAYDVVFAAQTPAIRDYDSLMKMNLVARRYCCLVSSAGSYKSSLRNVLWEAVTGSPLTGRAFDIQFPFNILYQEGYLPNLRFFAHACTLREPLDYVVEHYICYFKIFGYAGVDVEDKIRHLLEQKAGGNYCEDQVEATTAVMWWSVDK